MPPWMLIAVVALRLLRGEATVWFAGNKTMGPLPSDELQAEDYIKMVPKWQEEFGPGAAWIEQICAYKYHTSMWIV